MNNENKSPSAESSGQGGAKPEQNQDKMSRVHGTAEQLKTAAMDQVHEARHKADTVKEQAVNRIQRVASALKSTSESLRAEDAMVAEYAGLASQRIEDVARYIGGRDPRDLVKDAERVARENPAWFFGGAFVLGMAAARFLKSSRESEIEYLDHSGSGSGLAANERGTGVRERASAAMPAADKAPRAQNQSSSSQNPPQRRSPQRETTSGNSMGGTLPGPNREAAR